MKTSSATGFVAVWVAEYPTEEAARAELDHRIAESYPTGTATAWEWTLGRHRESHRPQILEKWRKKEAHRLIALLHSLRNGPPRRDRHPPPLTLYPFAVIRRITSPENGPPRPLHLREVAGLP